MVFPFFAEAMTIGLLADAAGRQSDIVRQVKYEPVRFRNAHPKHPAAWRVMEETSTRRSSTEPM